MPVIPATREAEAGELLEPGRRRLQLAKIAPLYSSLAPGDRETLSQKKKSQSGIISALWEAKMCETRGQEMDTILANMVKPHL